MTVIGRKPDRRALGASLMVLEDGGELRIVRDGSGLALVQGRAVVRADFSHMARRLKPANLSRELLVKAARCRKAQGAPLAVDATAGLGDDSLLLAAAGFNVHLYERNATIAALLRDALERAARDPSLCAVVGRMTLHEEDSVPALGHLPFKPDVVLLDPMFPGRQKSSAVKKKLHMLQQLEQPCDDEGELLQAALSSQARKIVVKRPAKGPFLAGVKPDYSLEGKAIRYDVHVRP